MHQHPARGPAAVAFVRGPLPLFGPAFVAAIAYVDPGNFATNVTAGSPYGYCWCGSWWSATSWRC